tara:strand:- start:35548 stop:36447 length:900 start_codon:yes stop_codon:yes gene_type:complete
VQKEVYRASIAHPAQFTPAIYKHFTVEPITGALGAEILGLDVAANLDNPEVAEEIRSALFEHLVLLFRGQALERETLRHFGQLFGTLQRNPTVKKAADTDDVMLVRQEAEERFNFSGSWHSDVTWGRPPAGETALYAMDVPPCGGDTHFANTALAYDALSEEMKAMLSGLKAVHSLEVSQREFSAKKPNDADADVEDVVDLFAEHPVVCTHPVTGRKCLFVNEQFTHRFVGMSEEESCPLLETLFRHQVLPDFTCRVRWQPGTLALWDNRATIHYASNDYPNIRREMMRVSTVGDVPVA